MEFWEELDKSRVLIDFYPDLGEDPNEHWEKRVREAYTECLRRMGSWLLLDMNPSYVVGDYLELLTGVEIWDKKIVKECYISAI